jgi:hypothetical protein
MGIQGTACPPIDPAAASSCQDPNQPVALNALQTTATQSLTNALSVCQAIGHAVNMGVTAYISTIPTVPQANYQNQVKTAQDLAVQAQKLYQQIKSIQSTLTNTVTRYATVPVCNVLDSSDVNAMASSITSAANTLASSCANINSVVNTSTVSPLLGQLTSMNSNFMATANGQPTQILQAKIRSMESFMATTNNGSIGIGQLLGPYTSAASSSKLSTNTGNPIVNQLNDPVNAGLVSVMTSILQSTDPQNLVPLGDGLFGSCSATQTKFQTSMGAKGQVGYQAAQDPVTPNSPAGSVCVDSTRAAPAAGGGQWIYLPAVPGHCESGPAPSAMLSYSLQVPYSNGQGQLNLYVQAETTALSGSVTIEPRGGQAVTFPLSSGVLVHGDPGSPSPPNVTVPVSTPQMAGMMSVSVTLNGAGEFWMSVDNGSQNFLSTSSQWFSAQDGQTQAQKNNGFTAATGVGGNSATTNIQTPSAVQNSVSCQAAVQCLGTQCHSILGTQDQSFTNAAAGFSTLSSIAQNACCAPGTSIAQGNCDLMVFCGKANTCRDFLLSGAGITNNCCNQPINTVPWSTMIKVFAIAYAQGWVPSYSGTLMSYMPNWLSSSYDSLSAWYNETTGAITSAANEVWSTVTGPFKSVAQSWSNAFGGGGPTAMAQFFSGLTNFTGTGKTETKGTTDTTYATTGSNTGQTSAVNMTDSSGGLSSAINGVGTAANMLSGSLMSVGSRVIETIAPQYSAAIEQALFGSATPNSITLSGEEGTLDNGIVVRGADGANGGTANGGMMGNGILGDIAMAYAIYQIACLVGHLLTRCTNEEFTFYSNRHQRLCFNVGSYCSHKTFFGICLERTYTSCCYPSMIERIIMQQLLTLDPGIVPNSSAGSPYGSAQNPACDGLTPQALQAVAAGGYMNQVNLSEYIAYLLQNNMLPTTNSQGSQFISQETNNTTGLVDEQGKPTTNAPIYTGQ